MDNDPTPIHNPGQSTTTDTESQPVIYETPAANMAQTPSPRQTAHYGMSASQLGLNTHGGNGFSWLRLIRWLLFTFILLAVAAGSWWYVKERPLHVSNLASYNVTQSSPEFSVKFYPGATVQQKGGNTYLILMTGQRQTALWITPSATQETFGDEAPFQFSFGGQTITGGHDGTDLYTASVTINHLIYQINLNAQKPVSLADAKAIFSSINIEIQ